MGGAPCKAGVVVSGGARRHVALIVDTETRGLAVADKPLWDPCQPWPVEIAALLVQQDEPGGELRARGSWRC